METEDGHVMRDVQGVQWIIKGNGKKRGKHYQPLLDICPSGTKADEKKVGKNTGRSKERNKTTVVMAKNEVSMFTRFDQRGNPCRNTKTKIWKRRGAKEKAEDFSKCDDRVLAHILGKEQ